MAKEFKEDEVAKHNAKGDVWVIINSRVLDVSKFLPVHPGGEVAIMAFAGKDASEEWNMIHKPDVIDTWIGKGPVCQVGTCVGGGDGGGGGNWEAIAAAGTINEAGDKIAMLQSWGKWREELDHNPGVFVINIWSYFKALWYVIVAIVLELVRTIFAVPNFKFNNDRIGLTRSAMFLLVFMLIHAVGNMHVYLGPDDFNGYGYFFVRLYCTGFGLQANFVEEYLLLAAILHVLVALKRTWDLNLNYSITSGKVNLAMTGILLLTFMTTHLFQFRFGDTQPYLVRPPPYLINLYPGILTLNLFWVNDPTVEPVPVRDVYDLEFRIFSDFNTRLFYNFSAVMFMIHGCLGWAKVVPAPSMNIPKCHHHRVIPIGQALVVMIGLMYISFPIYTGNFPRKLGALGQS